MKGHGKSSTPGWKIFQVEHPVAAPSSPIRHGPIELRIQKAYLEENKTIFATQHWKAEILLTVVSSQPLPLSELNNAFTIIGKSGKSCEAHVSTVGPGRRTWQHQEHTGQPTYLPAGVVGEVNVWTLIGDAKSHDELASFTFRGIQVPLGR